MLWPVVTVVLEFPWCLFLLRPVLLPRLLALVSPKRDSLFLKEEGEWDEAPRAQRCCFCHYVHTTGVLSVLLIIASIY